LSASQFIPSSFPPENGLSGEGHFFPLSVPQGVLFCFSSLPIQKLSKTLFSFSFLRRALFPFLLFSYPWVLFLLLLSSSLSH